MKIRIKLVKEWIANHQPNSKERLAVETGINYWTIDRILRGARLVKKIELIALSKVTGIPEEKLLDA